MQAHFGRYRDFGLYTDSLAGYGSRMFYYVWDVPIFCVMGAMGGLLGALWVHLNVHITALRHRYVPVRCCFDEGMHRGRMYEPDTPLKVCVFPLCPSGAALVGAGTWRVRMPEPGTKHCSDRAAMALDVL